MNRILTVFGKIAFWLTWPGLWVYLRIGTRTRLLMVCGDEFLVLKGWLGPGRWILPGGGLHQREEPLDGLIREVREETGVTLDRKNINFAYRSKTNQFGLQIVYDCFVVELPEKPIIKTQRREISAFAWNFLHNPTVSLSQDTVQALDWWKNKV